MSWLYSRALVEEFWAATCSDGAPSAQWKETPTPRAYCSPDKMTDVFRLSRFGMTFAPLTDDRGAALSTWYREDFLARTSASPGAEPELMEPGLGFGLKCLGLLARFNPDSCSWRTPQLSLVGGGPASLQTLPRWGIAVDGELWQLQMSVLRTSENVFGYWPTPQASDNRDRGHMGNPAIQRRVKMGKQINLSMAVKEGPGGGALNPTWVEWLMGWPLGWTDFAPLEMDRFQQWLQLHSLD